VLAPSKRILLTRCLAAVAVAVLALAALPTNGRAKGAASVVPHAAQWPGNPFSPTSIWNAALPRQAAIDRKSRALVHELVRQVDRFGPWMNTTSYSTPVYVVSANQPTEHVTLKTWGPDLQQAFDAVPIPDEAVASTGTDQQMTVWQPSTNKLWEFWSMQRSRSGWQARWGGEMGRRDGQCVH
jgi:hypothetical protein